MRLIDADAFKAEGRKLYRDAGWDLREVHYSQLDTECHIDMMPTIEAVPFEDYQSMEQTVYKLTQALAEAEPFKKVVRCKDCKHWDNHDGGERCLNSIYLSWAKPENFCNYGERKDEVEE